MIEFIQAMSWWQYICLTVISAVVLWWIGFWIGKGFSRIFWQTYRKELDTLNAVKERFNKHG